MDRRHFIERGLLVLGTAILPTREAFARFERHEENGPKSGVRAPYGENALKDINLGRLKDSLKWQILDAGKILPVPFDPFPRNAKGDPSFQVAATTGLAIGGVIGESEKNASLDGFKPDLDRLFRHAPDCGALAVRDNFIPWRAFLGLHETAHALALQMIEDELNANVRLFNTVNQITDKKPDFYNAAKAEFPGRLPTNTTFVAETTLLNLPERLADTAATFYFLSNFGDRKETEAFLRDVIDLRDAHYLGGGGDAVLHPAEWIKAVARHNTSSSIEAAITTFDNVGKPSLSIESCVEIATSIITTQPEFRRSIDQIAQGLGDELSARRLLWYGREDRTTEKDLGEFPKAQRARIEKLVDNISEARARACKVPLEAQREVAPKRPIPGVGSKGLFSDPQP